MKNIIKNTLPILAMTLLFCTQLKATTDDIISIPVLENARVFSQFTDKFPATINYFTAETESNIINFYTKHYGEQNNKTKKNGRTILTYTKEKTLIRVIISQQDKVRQVDVIYQLK